MKHHLRLLPFTVLSLCLSLVACGDDDEPSMTPDTGPDRDTGPGRDMGPDDEDMGPDDEDMGPDDEDMGPGDEDMGPGDPDMGTPDGGPPPPVCEHDDSHFDLSDTAGDGWPTCSADDGAYDLFDMSVSTFARVSAFEMIADLLWRRDGVPDADDFLAAREAYSLDNGLGSRVGRRFDAHYPACSVTEPAMTNECQRPGATEMCAERCVGPARLEPIVLDAFMAGAMGMEPELNAARVEAALWWFFWTSAFKEANTCADVIADCDSSIGYYRGDSGLAGDGLSLSRATDPTMSEGIARYVLEADPDADLAVFEASLAVRCWREMDNPEGIAMNPALRDQALGQLDRALDRAFAVAFIARTQAFDEATGTAKAVHWEFLRTLGPAIDRSARLLDADAADALAAELAKTDPTTVDAELIVTTFETLYPCAY